MPPITRKSLKSKSKSKPKSKPKRSTRPPPPPPPQQQQQQQSEDSTPIYFWKPAQPHGIFSQWHASSFTAPINDTTTTFETAEQYMMYRKALLFNDPSTAAEILATADPSAQRALGRKVSGFDQGVWERDRSRIVEEGSYWKFKPDPSALLETGERQLVEASPRDMVWGIGIGAEAAAAGRKWRGMNLLGKALMVARGRLRGELEVGGS